MTLLEARKGEFYDEWEAVPEAQREELRRERLDNYLRFARELPFYRDRLQGYRPGATYPLAEIPVLTATELRAALPPHGTGLVSQPRAACTVFQSGGTTGIPKSTLFSHDELEGLNLPNARGFFALGLTETDRVANLWAVGSLYMTFVHINRMLQQYGCQSFPFSNHTAPDFVHGVAKLYGINCFSGIASVVLGCLRAIEAQTGERLQVEKVLYGGEHLYESDKKEIREKFGARVIAAPGYGTVDTWYLGYQCLECPTGVFHAHDDQSYLEIVDEDTGKHAAPGEIGMLYATAFPRRLTPIVRYRIGDRAKWLGACTCGRTTPRFHLLGRGDDVLRVGFDSVDYQAVQDAVLKVEGLTGSIQLEKRRREGRDLLIIRVETALEPAAREGAKRALEQLVMESRASLREFIHQGTVWPLQLELVALNELPRNPRTGKLIRVIDTAAEPG